HGVDDVVGGDDARAMARLALVLDERVERYGEQSPGHRDAHQVHDHAPASRPAEEGRDIRQLRRRRYTGARPVKIDREDSQRGGARCGRLADRWAAGRARRAPPRAPPRRDAHAVAEGRRGGREGPGGAAGVRPGDGRGEGAWFGGRGPRNTRPTTVPNYGRGW